MSRKDVMIVTGAGQISMAIARRVSYGKKIVMGDKNINNKDQYISYILIKTSKRAKILA